MYDKETLLEHTVNELRAQLSEAEKELAHIRGHDSKALEEFSDNLHEQQLGSSEFFFKQALESLPTLAYIKNSKGQYVYANPLSRKALQLKGDYLFKTDFDLFPLDFAKTTEEHERMVIKSRHTQRFIEVIPSHKKLQKYVYVYRFPIPLGEGDCLVGAIALDVDDQTQIERQLMNALAELEESHSNLRGKQESLSLAYEEMAAYNQELIERNHRYVTLYNELLEAKQQIEKSEARWQLASYASNTVFWEYNFLDSQKTWHSPVMEKLFGYEGNEALNTTEAFLNIIHPDDKETVLRMVEENLREGGLYNVEYRVYAKNGDLRWVRATGKTKYDKEGNPTHLSGSIIDITDIKNNELELQALKTKLEQKVKQRTKDFVESEQKFRNAFEYSGIGICLLDLSGVVRDANHAFCQILGYTNQELQGIRDSLLLHPDDFNQYNEDFKELLYGNASYIKGDRRFKKKNGQSVHGRYTISTIVDQKGASQYLIAQLEDITEVKKAEEKILMQSDQIQTHNEELNTSLQNLSDTTDVLQKSEEKYRMLTENMSDVVSMHDDKGNYMYVSPSIKDLIGYDQEEVLQKTLYDFIHLDDRQKVWQETHRELLAGETENVIEFRMREKNGAYLYVESKSRAKRNNEGNLEWIQVNIRDVTERYKAIQAISIKNKQIKFILDNLPIILYSLDTSGNITYMSGSFLSLLVGEKGDVVGKSAMEVIPLESKGRKCIEQALQGNKVTWEGQFGNVHFKHTLVPIKNKLKQVTGVTGLTEDITLDKEVQEHLHFLTSALVNIHEAVVILDAKKALDSIDKMPISYVNPAFTTIFGYELQEAVQHSLAFLVVNEAKLELLDRFLEGLGQGQSPQEEFLAHSKSGASIWVEISVSPVTNEEGKLTHCVGVLRDITDRKKAEELLYQERQLFHEGLAVAMKWGKSMDGRVTRYISPNIKQYGYEIEDFIEGRVNYMHDFIHPEDREMVLKKMENIHRGETNKLVADYRVLCKNQRVRWVHDYTVYLDHTDKAVSGYGYIIDITDRKEAERELQATMGRELKAEQRFRSIAEHFPNGWVALIDTNMQIKFLGGSELPHFAAGAEAENTQSVLTLFPKGYQEKLKDAIGSVLDGQPAKFDIQDGQKYYLINVVRTDSNKKEPDILMTGQDITTIKEALKKEKELNDLKSRFVSMTSHQFRTPLSTIQTNIELMTRSEPYIDPDFRPKFQRYAARTKRQIDRLTDLMNDILILGRVEAGRLQPNKSPVEFERFLKEIILQNEHLSQSKHTIKLKVEGSPQKVNIDGNLMNHAIDNLLSNALKYSEGSRDPEVSMQFNEHNVLVEIEDFGIGIPEEELKNLFNSFFRASNTLEIEGTGLGLVISKQIIEAHGGHLDLFSVENEGTTVTLTLPIYEP